tara:strand:+ start:6755 stop:11029 length:4275 start_codon:yes stop_codon:yes gene_type:complete
MGHSPVAKDVILEIGKEEGVASVDVTYQTGIDSEDAFTDTCRNYGSCNPGVILNHLPDFDASNYPRKGFEMNIVDIQSFGDCDPGYTTYGDTGFYAAQGNPHFPYMAGTNLGFQPPQYNMSFIFKFTQKDGTTPIEFNGLYNSLWHCCPADACNVKNRVIDGDQDTEAGRMLYLYPKAGAEFISPSDGSTVKIEHALSFEIMDGGNDLLVVRGTGTEAPWEYLKTHSNNSIDVDAAGFYKPELLWKHYDAFITPYVHTANWKYSNGFIEYKADMKHIHMSCLGRGVTRQYSPSIESGDRFGIRSKEELFNCEENYGGGNGYNCLIEIAEMKDCHLEWMYGEYWHPQGSYGGSEQAVQNNGLNNDTSSLPWVWDKTYDPGTHEICCPFTYDGDMILYEYYSPGIVGQPCNNVTQMITEYGGGGAANCAKNFMKSQNEFFRIVVTGPDPICKISKFEIRELMTEMGERIVPVYATTSISVPNYEWTYLDIMDRDQNLMALTFTSADLRDPGKRSAGYSKTFELPASKHNQKWIETLTGVGSVRDLDKISWHKARIQANGIFVFEGYARIEQSITGQGGRYKCHILQDPTYWPELLKGLKICELPLPTHQKNYDNVVSSWSNNQSNIDYVYPVIDYGAWFPGTYAAPTPNQPKSLRDFHPATYVRSIIRLIFEQIGYNLDSNFFDSSFFKKLILPYTSGEEYDNTGTAMGDGGSFSLAASRNAEDNDFPNLPATGWGTYTYRTWSPIMQFETDPANIHTHNTSHNSINNGYVCPFSGRYVIMYDAEVYQSQGYDGGQWFAWITINGKILQSSGANNYANNPYSWGGSVLGGGNSYLPTNAPYNATSFDGYSCRWNASNSDGTYIPESLGFEIDLQIGDKIQVWMKGRNSNCCHIDYSRIKNQNFHVWPHASNTTVPESTVSLAASLPCTNQIDFLKGITNMFNLHWTADESTKTVSVEPYDTFYGSGKVLDWTSRLDKTTWTDKFLIEELAQTITWKYKLDDGDLIVDRRNLSMLNAYGSPELWALEIEHGELYRKEAKDMGNKYFSPTMELSGANGNLTFGTSSASGPIMPCMWANQMPSWGWFNSTQRPDNNVKYKPRILNYHGTHTCPNWQLTDDSGNPQTKNIYPYSYTSNYNNINPGYDSCLAWHNHNGEQGLFDRYYAGLYEKISGGAALRSCMMDLSPNDISQVDMRDLIKLKIEGVYTYWTINKISDYKPGRDELTKVELIEWKYGDGGVQKIETHQGDITNSYGGDGKGGGKRKVTGKSGITFINNATKEHVNNIIPKSEQDKANKAQGGMSSFIDISTAQSNNVTGQQSITIGDSLKARGNQVVLGKANAYNPTDIFQVGGGYKDNKGDWIRQNAITVSDSGEVTIYGGEVVADFTIGDLTLTGDVYVEEIIEEGYYNELTGGGATTKKVKKKLYLK